MRVETERSRDGYRGYSDRKYHERFRRETHRYHDQHYHSSSNISLKSHHQHRHHHHHHNDDDYPIIKRIGNNQSNSYTDYSRFNRQINNRDIYSSSSSSLNDQPSIPPTDLYYNSSQSTHERDIPKHYIDSERDRYTPTINKSSFRRENSSPSYRNQYHTSTPSLSLRTSIDSYNEISRTPNDYQNRSERYDIPPQNRNSSIISSSSPVYHSDSYQTSSYKYIQSFPSLQEVDYRTRDYGLMDHHQTVSNLSSSNHYHSHRDRSNLKRLRSTNFNENNSKRPMRR